MVFVDVFNQLENIAQIVRRCPTNTLRRAYVRALREWCGQTYWLRENIPGQTEANVQQYALGDDTYLEIAAIVDMQGQAFQQSGSNPAPQFWPIGPSDSSQWDPNIATGVPSTYQYLPQAQFALFPIPNDIYGLTVTVALQPKEGAQQIPQPPLIKWSNEIEAGALAYLLSIPGQPWSNPAEAARNDRVFRSAIANGKAEVQKAFNVGTQRARPRPFVQSRGFGWSLRW
jgi:hypothetical protein